MQADREIRAAGAVLWREGAGGVELAVIHRPKYDDWSLPKGKLDEGEDDLGAARREVLEETGYRAEVGPDLGFIAYVQHRNGRNRNKVVRYWSMRAVGGTFTPHAEVDRLRWLAPAEAKRRLSYDRDRQLVDRFLAVHA